MPFPYLSRPSSQAIPPTVPSLHPAAPSSLAPGLPHDLPPTPSARSSWSCRGCLCIHQLRGPCLCDSDSGVCFYPAVAGDKRGAGTPPNARRAQRILLSWQGGRPRLRGSGAGDDEAIRNTQSAIRDTQRRGAFPLCRIRSGQFRTVESGVRMREWILSRRFVVRRPLVASVPSPRGGSSAALGAMNCPTTSVPDL